jgi:3-phenylpropionate/trans-cinnamate dioxygenase ferredoxin reductase subunit
MRDREDDLQVLMLYGNRTESSIVFRDELAQLEAADRPSLKVVHVLSHAAEAWQGETGYVDQDMLKRHVTGDLTKKTFYVCGPPPMIDLTLSNLREMGVEDRQIRLELFSLVDG